VFVEHYFHQQQQHGTTILEKIGRRNFNGKEKTLIRRHEESIRSPGDESQRRYSTSSTLFVAAGKYDYATHYTFGADRFACDGQCMYCSNSHVHARWSRVREVLSTYQKRHEELTNTGQKELAAVWHFELQELLEWSWQRHQFECVPGIISLRLASYEYTDMHSFIEADNDVLDFLIQMNAHTGVLDLLQSSWPGILQGGWPLFAQMDQVSRKVKAFLADLPEGTYENIHRNSECDSMDVVLIWLLFFGGV